MVLPFRCAAVNANGYVTLQLIAWMATYVHDVTKLKFKTMDGKNTLIEISIGFQHGAFSFRDAYITRTTTVTQTNVSVKNSFRAY